MTLESPERLREEIVKVRKLTDQPFAVNIAFGMGRRPYMDFVQVAIEEEVPAISITGGNPVPVIEQIAKTNIKSLVLVSSVRQAQKAEEHGASAVIAVGFEGGGHLGRDDVGTMVLIPRIVDSVKIPVIASGGIGDARGFTAALALGAEGIEMGTRFIATKECVAHPDYKQALINLTERDTVIIKRSLGQPGRAIKNKATECILSLEKEGAGFEELEKYINAESNKLAIYEGKYEEAYSWAGQVIGLIDDIPTCEELIQRIIQGSSHILQRLDKLKQQTT
jgi:NAD(P)H-dependent flavin oxidoreductase YrpB (nitropropane dioxygenase family)